MIVTSLAFITLAALSLAFTTSRKTLLARTRHEWIIDSASLIVQGLIFPPYSGGACFRRIEAAGSFLRPSSRSPVSRELSDCLRWRRLSLLLESSCSSQSAVLASPCRSS